MTEEEDVGQVEINQEDNEIVFTDKDGSAYTKPEWWRTRI